MDMTQNGKPLYYSKKLKEWCYKHNKKPIRIALYYDTEINQITAYRSKIGLEEERCIFLGYL